MSLLTHQSAVNATTNFWSPSGSGGGGGGTPANIVCSTLTAAVQVSTSNVQTTKINGASYLINGVGNNLDAVRSLQTTPNYAGTNVFWNVTNDTPGTELYLDPDLGGVVGGRWIQTTNALSNAPWQIQALPNGSGSAYETVEVIQGTDNTSRLYFFSGAGSQGPLQTQWQKVAGTYTKECSFTGYQVGPLAPGIQTFSTPKEYVAGQFLPYRIVANGRVSLNAGTPTTVDSVSISVGFGTTQAGYVVGTNLILGQSGRITYPWTISGTISDQNSNLSPIQTVYTDTNLGSNASYDLYIDSFTVAQL